MMKRGAHLSFIHFYGTGARPGESSLHVASGLVRQLVRYQFRAKLYRVPFEEIQREIVRYAPENYRVLLYRRMMLRISQVLAGRDHALALVTGDSLGQVASQTLRNLVAVDAAARMPVFRPLIGTDKMEILATAHKIGTYDISSEPFHDCCPVFLPRTPALYARPEELDEAEAKAQRRGTDPARLRGTTIERFDYSGGVVEASEPKPLVSGRQTAHRPCVSYRPQRRELAAMGYSSAASNRGILRFRITHNARWRSAVSTVAATATAGLRRPPPPP